MLEKGLSKNSIEAYTKDVQKLYDYFELENIPPTLAAINLVNLQGFLQRLNDIGLATSSQARIISGLKAYTSWLLIESYLQHDPCDLLEAPKGKRYLPSVLSIEEVDAMMAAVDLSKPEGHRNLAILETLYACGLRVSELINLQMSKLYLQDGIIRVIGKGNKERWIPIGETAVEAIKLYLDYDRKQLKIVKGHEDFVFLSRRGRQLTRMMVFLIVKQTAEQAGIETKLSPHTFRHSFATHLIEGGADLKVVQDLLGHESITTTEIYTHLQTAFLRETLFSFHPLYQPKK
jgi:integrase/recombinase XerD